MRWGINHEATNNHMATTICLNEINNCQNLSIGPNFIVILFLKINKAVNSEKSNKKKVNCRDKI
jgi:hypothetical protein